LIKVKSEYIWLSIAIEAKSKEILALTIFKERNMFVAERFLSDMVRDYGKHQVTTDGGDDGVHNTKWHVDSLDLNIRFIPLWRKV
jgi:transposase-like protein